MCTMGYRAVKLVLVDFVLVFKMSVMFTIGKYQ